MAWGFSAFGSKPSVISTSWTAIIARETVRVTVRVRVRIRVGDGVELDLDLE